MNNSFGQPPLPSLGKLALGSAIFTVQAASTLPTLITEVSRTALQTTSHGSMNADQRELLGRNPQKITILVPGFQLDGTSLLALKKSFNDRHIPALFPDSLPFGIDAVLFRHHPQILVEKIADYIRKIQKQYQAEIILVGHSFGGTQVLHATNLVDMPGIAPVTISGLLEPVGLMAFAPHALYYRHAADIFSGEDSEQFILKTQFMQLGVDEQAESKPIFGKHIAVVNPHDGYLSTQTQAGAYRDVPHDIHVLTPSQKTPRHYLQGRTPVYTRDIVGAVLQRLKELDTIQ